MFPPKAGAGAPPPPPRNLRDVRRSVGTTAAPDDVKPKDSVTVSLTCPGCGYAIDKTFRAEPEAGDEGALGGAPVQAPPSPMGGM